MTVERTKQLLGAKISHLSDEEILQFLQATDGMLGILMQKSVKRFHAVKAGKDEIQ